MTAPQQDRFEVQFAKSVEPIEEPIKIYKTALRLLAKEFGAGEGAVVLRHSITGHLTPIPFGGKTSPWDERRLRAFLDLKRPELKENELMAPLLIGGRAAGVVALRSRRGPFPPGAGRFLAVLCRKLAREIAIREERRINRVVDQIRDRTVRELRPKDLFYQVLHGLRTLTRYDHSSALLIAEEEAERLVLHAEQIAWTKGKSGRIGKRIRLPAALRASLRRTGGARVAAPGREPFEDDGVARLLRWGGRRGEPAEGTILWAPLLHDGALLGVLKIAAIAPGAFGGLEKAAVQRVVPHVASVIHNARRALSMEERIIAAEKKHAMADLARAISHDVKNAIGAILPLAQQALEEVEGGAVDRAVLAEDLRQIEQSARVCQRIFDGMLQLARSDRRPAERAPLAKILEGPLGIVGSRLRRLGVTLENKIPDGLPEVNVSRGGLEQVFLNLLTNALESMSAGGRLRIGARAAGGRLEVKISDTGSGIPPEELRRIHEPFYTTKEDGFGLGLAICRSILWEGGGEMTIASEPGRGTTVTVLLPIATAPAAATAVRPGSAARSGPAAPRPAGA
ncbi:MAG: sensor histidine kinase [Candidatus Polarisedimenticolia bacterium]